MMKINPVQTITQPDKLRWVILHLFAALLAASCASRVPLDEAFTVALHQDVVVSGTSLGIRCEAIGHGWYGDGGHFLIVDLAVTVGGSQETVMIEEEVHVGDYVIHLLGVDDTKDTCRLRVSQE